MLSSLSDPKKYDFAVIGGGAAGLVCAYELAKAGRSVYLTEKGNHWGGVIHSERVGENNEYLIEHGPNSFSNHPDDIPELAAELGLGDKFLAQSAREMDRFVWDGRAIKKVAPKELLLFGLLPVSGELRAAAGFVKGGTAAPDLAPANLGADEDATLGSFFKEHFGPQLVERLITPVMSGVYAADPMKMSLSAALGEAYGKLAGKKRLLPWKMKNQLEGSKFNWAKYQKNLSRPVETKSNAKKKQPRALCSFVGGLETFTEAIAEYLEAFEQAGISINNSINKIAKKNDGSWQLEPQNGEPVLASTVVIATPAYGASSILADVCPEAAHELGDIEYNGLSVVHFACSKAELPGLKPGFGFLAQRKRNLRALGMIFSHDVFAAFSQADRAPKGDVLLTCFYGGELDPAAMQLSDSELHAAFSDDLRTALGWTGAGEKLFHVTRWQRCLPLYRPGHLAKIARIYNSLPNGIHLAGNYIDGAALPKVINGARRLAKHLAATCDTPRHKFSNSENLPADKAEEVLAHA